MKSYSVVGYTYNADCHCVTCALKTLHKGGFGVVNGANGFTVKGSKADENGIPEETKDSDGNEIQPIFAGSEEPCTCGDCGDEIIEHHSLANLEIFYLEARDFLEASADDWRSDLLRARIEENNYETAEEIEEDRQQEAKDLAGWYWWTCCPGCMPDSDAFGPFKTAAAAQDDANSN